MADYSTLPEKMDLLGEVQMRNQNIQRVLTNAKGAEGDMIGGDKPYSTHQMTVQSMLSGMRNLIELSIGDLETLMQQLLYVPVMVANTSKGLISFEFGADAVTHFSTGGGGAIYNGKSYVIAVGVTGESKNPFNIFEVADVLTITNAEHGDNIGDFTIHAILLSEDSDITDGGQATVADNVIIMEESTMANTQDDISAVFTLKSR